MNSILVPVDFSDASINAAKFAARLARDFKAKIHLLNVYHIPNPLQTLPIELVITPDELQDATQSQLKRLGDELIPLLNSINDLSYSSRNGHSAQEILDHVKYLHADLIVMGTKGTGKFSERIIGSTADRVTRNSMIPVLLIHENCPFKIPMNAIFAAGEKNENNEFNIDLLKQLNQQYDTQFEIVHVAENGKTLDNETIISMLESQFMGLPHAYHFPTSNSIEEGLEKEIISNRADWLILNHHHRSFFSQISEGDTAIQLIHHFSIPILCLN